MKKIILLFIVPILFSCDNKNVGIAGIIKSNSDIEHYNETEYDDDLSKIVLELANDYSFASFDSSYEIYSDTVSVMFNKVEVKGKEDLIDGWQFEHQVFSDIKISDQYVHTNYFSDGRVWSNFWFTWTATGNFTGKEIEIKGHFDYRWEDGKIVEALGFFDASEYNKEYELAQSAE